ncbi:hypothetical protein BKA70DRAFT_1235017 [Coprinopsis sp. MPI-PUGE-AT-0042]|nr:hypothetical protein BKA70DRAFT_1235017 [Coprinopsis sp. MPI-PUGE-AT-0042]
MDEADLKEVKAEVRYHMRCAFFGTDCEEVQMVPVPVHAGYEEDTMACDLYHRFYVNTLNPCHNRVIRFEDFTIDVGSWPRESNKSSKYVVFYGNGDQNGVVEEVERKDLGTISEMLVKVLWERQFNMVPEFWADTVETRATLRPPPRYAAADHRQGLISPTHLRRSDRITTREEAHLAGLHHSRLDWHDLMRIAKVSKHGQACVRVQISDRIRYLLDRWIPAIHMQDFLNALNRSGAVVVGSVARRLFSYIASGESCTRWIGPMTSTSLLLPEGRQSAGRFFQSIGYDTWLSEEVACHYHGFASGMERGYMCREDGQSNEVTITEATGGVVPVVVASPTTCQLNMFSSTHPLHLCAPLHNKVHGDAD